MSLVPSLPLSASSPNEQTPRSLDRVIWPIVPRAQHHLDRHVSDMGDIVTELTESE